MGKISKRHYAFFKCNLHFRSYMEVKVSLQFNNTYAPQLIVHKMKYRVLTQVDVVV